MTAGRTVGEWERVLGWREWVALTDWSVPHVKAKLDTGARTSSLHAFGVESFDRAGREWVRFDVHPWQRSATDSVRLEAPVIEHRRVKSSTANVQIRPVVLAKLHVGDIDFETEVTLTNRDEMGFRMLLGRRALRGRFLVDSGASYLSGRPPKRVRAKNRRRA